jgi:RNA polymerase sigma-70 factor (ECF subfamily)
MVGSVFEGEDVVQEAFAKAMEAQPAAGALENGERWLFTVAHNTALDALRRRKRYAEVSLDDADEELPGNPAEAEAWIGATASLATLMQLPVIQRSAVVMLDVLEYSLAETVEMLESTLPAVKAAAHRGRQRLKALADAATSTRVESTSPDSLQSSDGSLERLRAYADAFNARDFDKLRNLLAEDVKLDLVNRTRLAGSKNVSVYFTRYSERHDLKVAAGYAEGRPALLFFSALDSTDTVKFVVFIGWDGDEIKVIRDFHYADYIADGLVAWRA